MEEKKELNKREIAEKLLKTINELDMGSAVERKIKDNKIIFKVAGKIYRVRRPTYQEQMDSEKFRRTKYVELVNDKSMLFKKQWVKKYKEKGIDLDKMDIDVIALQNKVEGIMLRLAKSQNDKDVKKLRDEIVELRTKQAMLSVEKTDLLSYSIEDQLMIAVNSYYAYLLLEKPAEINEDDKEVEDGKWIRVFDKYEDFTISQDSDLITKTYRYVSDLIYTPSI